MTFAMTFPPGTHAMWMRYWLAAGGINPDKDVALIVVPPAQMVANMKVGKMDGFCVGEPWNARAIADGIGYTAINTQDIWKDHPEKVCAFTGEFADKNPKTVKAVLKALHEASVWLDDMKNRPEQAEIVSQGHVHQLPEGDDPRPHAGALRLRRRPQEGRPELHDLQQRNCNYPQPKYAVWWLTQFRRWGMVEGAPDYKGVAKTGDAAGHLRRGHEGDGRQARRPQRQAGDALRRDDVRPQGAREVRESFAVKHNLKSE